ncbi:MAG: ATP-binding protein, partial [Acidimicrobiia bacterium]
MEEDVAEFARSFRQFIERMNELAGPRKVSAIREALDTHLGGGSSKIPVVSQNFPMYDHVNVQVAIDSYLAKPGRQHQLVGLTGMNRHHMSLSDILESSSYMSVTPGPVDLINLAEGPDESRVCVQFGLYLISDDKSPVALLMRGPSERTPQQSVTLEMMGASQEESRQRIVEIQRLAAELNVFRGKVVSFGESPIGYHAAGRLIFHRRPTVKREDLILPPGRLESIETEVLSIAALKDRLLRSGQHLKRGLLLHGPPGCGKTFTVRYLVGMAKEHTVVLLTGGGLQMIRPACSLARLLQPSIVIMEDVDLIAHQRAFHPEQSNPLLFDLLNEMEGIEEEADIAFILTTNRADLLEPALAARPGRVDLAVEIGLPDEEARGRLIDLYGR